MGKKGKENATFPTPPKISPPADQWIGSNDHLVRRCFKASSLSLSLLLPLASVSANYARSNLRTVCVHACVCGCSFWNLLERFERENTVHARKQWAQARRGIIITLCWPRSKLTHMLVSHFSLSGCRPSLDGRSTPRSTTLFDIWHHQVALPIIDQQLSRPSVICGSAASNVRSIDISAKF